MLAIGVILVSLAAMYSGKDLVFAFVLALIGGAFLVVYEATTNCKIYDSKRKKRRKAGRYAR